MIRWTIAAALIIAATAFAQEEGRIMAPVEGAAIKEGPVRIIATAPAGKLLLDGKEIPADQPFPNVFHASVNPEPGEHVVRLSWQGGQKAVRFYYGPKPPKDFAPYREHPPIATECSHCHGLSRRGRFRFTGGCFSCHQKETFSAKHTHQPGKLDQCGMCHNAHGATTASLLIYPKEVACKLCHN